MLDVFQEWTIIRFSVLWQKLYVFQDFRIILFSVSKKKVIRFSCYTFFWHSNYTFFRRLFGITYGLRVESYTLKSCPLTVFTMGKNYLTGFCLWTGIISLVKPVYGHDFDGHKVQDSSLRRIYIFLFRTHPSPEDRIKNLKNLLA